MRIHLALAALAGLALRVFFVLKFPVTDTGDSPFYIELAWNWLKKGVYGFSINGQLTPVDMRVPGYPAFLAAIFTVAGQSVRAAMLAQALLDTAGCFLIALIAARLAPESSRRRVTLAALWLAALCPFIANYCAAILTETLVIFLTALAILVLLGTELGDAKAKESGSIVTSAWFLGGIVAGFGTLVRPETPLLLIAAGLVLASKWWRPSDWGKLARAGLLMGAGLLLPLLPWAARNWTTLHEMQFLAPRHSELPGEYTPLGFSVWTDTWLWRYRDVYRISWKADNEEISLDDIPASAFDSENERAHVEDILERYNETETIDRALDNEFRELARERTARHPLRTYLKIPALRALSLWFTPRIELLPFTGPILPLRDEWREDRRDLAVTAGLFLLNLIYIALAIAGAWAARARPGVAFLIVFILVRTIFFTRVETPEPRYVLECYPAVIALAAQVFAGKRQLSSTGSG
jgi:Dolichyl-phosphate-mannose-protein mannosyltransferase